MDLSGWLEFVCYLEFIIWCLTGILKNLINKYFAKNGQKIFIKGLMSFQVGMISILLAISKYIIIPVTSIIVVIRGADTIAGSSFK